MAVEELTHLQGRVQGVQVNKPFFKLIIFNSMAWHACVSMQIVFCYPRYLFKVQIFM